MNTVRGFCDFNIPLECSPTTTLKEVVIRAVKLGYSAIAINTIVQEDILMPTKKEKGSKKNNNNSSTEKKDIPPPSKLQFTEQELLDLKVHGKNVKILHRLTVVLSDPSNTQKLIQSPNAKNYDLIAVCPTTAAAFQHAVANMAVDIISFASDVEFKDIRPSRKQYQQATARGIFFEIPYAFMIRDATMRKKIIFVSHTYHSIGKSKNIIVSSGAESPCELRGPYDVANLGLLLGLTEGNARSALTLSGRSVALHAVTRKSGKSISIVVESDKLSPEDKWKTEELKCAEQALQSITGEPVAKKMKMDGQV